MTSFSRRSVVFLLPVFLSSFGVRAPSQDKSAQVAQLLAEGDSYTEKTHDHEQALTKYRSALTLDSLSYAALWKISRSYFLIGEHLPSLTDDQKEMQLQAYEEAALYGSKAVEVDPASAMGYVYRAAANIQVAQFKNIWKSSGLMNDVREDCERAIELDPSNHFAYYLLGRAHFRLSGRTKLFRWPFGVAWGNRDDAIQNFEKAIALHSTSILYHLDAARAYAENKEYQKSREHISTILALPATNEDDVRYRREASDLLEQIRKK